MLLGGKRLEVRMETARGEGAGVCQARGSLNHFCCDSRDFLQSGSKDRDARDTGRCRLFGEMLQPASLSPNSTSLSWPFCSRNASPAVPTHGPRDPQRQNPLSTGGTIKSHPFVSRVGKMRPREQVGNPASTREEGRMK